MVDQLYLRARHFKLLHLKIIRLCSIPEKTILFSIRVRKNHWNKVHTLPILDTWQKK